LRLILLTAVLWSLGSLARASEPAPSGPDLTCMAEAVYFEARGTGDAGALAVASVIANRAEAADFPGTICGVVRDGCQFSYRCDGRPEALTHAGERARAFRNAEAVLAGDAPDPTGGALFFHSAGVAPGWFATRPRVGEIAGNIFYR
jgi:N-acetylmuramoyl-L-alanine amidase